MVFWFNPKGVFHPTGEWVGGEGRRGGRRRERREGRAEFFGGREAAHAGGDEGLFDDIFCAEGMTK